MRDGRFAAPVCNGVQCRLCPYNCFLPEGARGRCKVRINYGGRIKTLVYAQPAAVHVDPVEKKPVYHMYPGSLIYSLAAPGCNLSCRGCQNWEISQLYPEQAPARVSVPAALEVTADAAGRVYGRLRTEETGELTPAHVVAYALATRSKAVAYTYSEPVVFYEYMYDTAVLARRRGLKNVLVSGGYINPGPLAELLPLMDVVKIDLKGFSENFYRRYTGGRLEPVKQALLEIKKKGVLLEVVNLVVPGLNDSSSDLEAMAGWVKDNLGAATPLFFSRFTPNYLLSDLPPTPLATLAAARAAAVKKGLKYVYLGNVPGQEGESTYCPKCGRVLIRRYGYAVLEDRLTPTGGRCPWDGAKVPGIW
ncbi:MAG: AmmeMemoRadiSam system radical SAM enzyme [Elusimicrobia bacterium GWA2_61_42]|nr:MAG: AmmeMemoRadiSam system radical SAM enzyme [Elusimicrobia bacterium GWA2_61_42]OGR75921.1 MAG: AmmeMemoRadiSam system radical SAM enzyme [Elusimicrobia bacterium GWC2_61_25]